MDLNKRAIYEEIHHEVRKQMRVLQEQKKEGAADYKWLSRRQHYPRLTEQQQQLMENLANKLSEEEVHKSLKLLEISIVSESKIAGSDVPDVMNEILKQLLEERKLAALFRQRPKSERKAVRSFSLPKDMNVIQTIAAQVETKESSSAQV